MNKKTYVIVGNGIAGLTAAMRIREQDETGEIILIGDEKQLTYSRPMITKAPIIGFDYSNFIIKDEKWYEENRITVMTSTRVTALSAENKEITLDNGQVLHYDKCILATGSESFVPPIPGADKKGVYVARKIADIAQMRLRKLMAKNAVVIGGGVIGLEMAWELKKAGLEVVVLEQAPYLMERLLDAQSAAVLEQIITSQGIGVVTGKGIDQIAGDAYAQQVILKDGTTYDADLVVLSCGIKPNIDLAQQAGAQTGRSIMVNAKMETSVKDLYACGDCAEFQGMNLALWEQSVKQGEIAAYNACGKEAEYTSIKTNLILNGMKTSLYMMGDLGKKADTAYETLVKEDHNKTSAYFTVNERMPLRYSYEKYYFVQGQITGGILIGDLSRIDQLQEWLQNGASYETVNSIINN